jgi:hypothetical protein
LPVPPQRRLTEPRHPVISRVRIRSCRQVQSGTRDTPGVQSLDVSRRDGFAREPASHTSHAAIGV